MAVSRALALALVAGCGASEPVVEPVVETPPVGAPAYPWDDLDSVVLLASSGGEGVSRIVSRGERPRLDGIRFGDDLVVHLLGRRAGAEVAYGRTCAVSFPLGGAQPPHLFFSRIVRWSDAVAPAGPQRDAATTTPDGAALFFGADDTVARFDPVAGTFTPLNSRVVARTGAVVATFADGRVLRVGGLVDGVPAEIFEVVSPGGNVTEVQDLRLRVVGHAAATLASDDVVVIGGDLTENGVTSTTGVTWLFTPAATMDRPRRLAARLAFPRRDHTLTRLGDDVGAPVLVVGGRDAAGDPVAQAEIYDPQAEAYFALRPNMLVPRYEHRAVRLPDGSVLILGGRDLRGVPVATVELYRPVAAQFADAGLMPPGAGLTGASATVLPDGRILVAGGRDANGVPVATAYIAQLDPFDGTVDFSPTASLSAARVDHAAVRLCDGTVLVTGGGPATAERYNPPSVGRGLERFQL